jgi:hypothetical protein
MQVVFGLVAILYMPFHLKKNDIDMVQQQYHASIHDCPFANEMKRKKDEELKRDSIIHNCTSISKLLQPLYHICSYLSYSSPF